MAKPPRRRHNPKRRIRKNPDPERLEELAARVSYGGNPAHKRDPGDFGLTPPSAPRTQKSLCDDAGILRNSEALELLHKGIRAGLISEQEQNGYPQNVWSVSDDGMPLEGQLQNQEKGGYHGYPMRSGDPLADEVLRRWGKT